MSRFNYMPVKVDHLRDKNISLEAKGLLTQIIYMLDDGKELTVEELLNSSHLEDEQVIRKILKELEEAGYLTVTDDKGGNNEHNKRR